MQIKHQVPEHLLQVYLNDPLYVKMHEGYTATVRNLKSFIDYFKDGMIDETFGEIVKLSNDPKATSQFLAHLLEVISEVKGMPTFNACKHTFIELDEPAQTVSIKTKSGKFVTVCVMEKASCIDIQYTDPDGKFLDNGGSQVPAFNLIGFGLGDTPVPSTEVTLATILT